MEQSNINKYVKGFSNELLNFLVYIDDLIPTETTQKIISKYEKLNMMKLIKRYRNTVISLKDRITARDVTIFSSPLFIVPEFNMSFFWNNLPDKNKDHVWEVLSRLIIYCNIVENNNTQTPQNSSPAPQATVSKEINPFIGIPFNPSENELLKSICFPPFNRS